MKKKVNDRAGGDMKCPNKFYKCRQTIWRFDIGETHFVLVKLIMREMAIETPLCANIDIITINHIEVNLESRDDMLCGPPTTTRESMQFIRLLMK